MELELHGHVAVVTGGASGIGLACAQRLAREGCDVALWDVARDVSGVAADLAIGGVVDHAPGIAGDGGRHAGHLAEEVFHAPETARTEQRLFHADIS